MRKNERSTGVKEFRREIRNSVLLRVKWWSQGIRGGGIRLMVFKGTDLQGVVS